MSSTERQRRYRAARRDPEGPCERQVNMVLSDATVLALARMAVHSGRTRRAVLEELVAAAQRDLLDGLSAEEAISYYEAVRAG